MHHRLHGTLGAQYSYQEEGKYTTRLQVMLISMLAAHRARERRQACLQAHKLHLQGSLMVLTAACPQHGGLLLMPIVCCHLKS